MLPSFAKRAGLQNMVTEPDSAIDKKKPAERHNVTGVGAVPGVLSDAPFYEGHHGRPVDPSDRIDSKMYRIEFEDIVALHLQCSF